MKIVLAALAALALSGCAHEQRATVMGGDAECLRIRSEHSRLVGQAESLSRRSTSSSYDKALSYRVNERFAIDVSSLDDAPGVSQSDRATRVVVNNRRLVYRDTGSHSDVSTRASTLDADISRLRVSYAMMGCDRVFARPVRASREEVSFRQTRRDSVRWIDDVDPY